MKGMSNPQPIESATHMTLTELLRHHLPPDRKQKSIAMDFHDRLEKAGHERLRSASYVESQFSRCLKGEVGAVRFFFAKREHAVALFAAMEIADDQHDAILRAAEQVIESNGEAPPRLVVDLTSWTNIGSTKVLFDAVLARVIEPKQIEPAVLLLTEPLFEVLPRNFDNVPWLRIEVVDSAEVEGKVAELIDAGALLASPSRHPRSDRWLALDYDERKGVLAFEPEDGLAQFARLGSLPLPVVEHDLAKYVTDDPFHVFDAATLRPIEARRLMRQLGDDAAAERVDPDPHKRLAMAKALGVAATATPRDRVEADLRAAIVGLGSSGVRTATTDELGKTLDRARRRHLGPDAMRVGDEIHVINPESTWSGLDHPRVQVHRIEAPEPWIVRLRATIADWTVGDFEADPYLVRAMDILDPDHRDVVALLHARAWVLNTMSVKPKRAMQIKDWRSTLRALLEEEVPEAMLTVSRDNQSSREAAFLSVPPTGRVASHMTLDTDTADRLRHVPAVIPSVPFARAAPVVLATPQADSWGYRGAATRLVLPHVLEGASLASLDEQWLDAYEAFQSGTRSSGTIAPKIEMKAVRESWPWEAADSLLSNVWLALRAAVEHAPAVRSANGRVLMSLGAGLAAEIDVSATATDLGLRAALECIYTSPTPYLTGTVATGVDGVTYNVPRRIILLGGRCRVQVRFVASPLLLGHGHSVGGTVIMQAAHSAAAEAARLAAEEDDYDDD